MPRRIIKLFTRGIVMFKKVFRLSSIVAVFFGLVAWGVFYGTTTVYANTLDTIGDLTENQQTIFSQNDILFYDPGECVPRSGGGGNVNVEGCFKVDDGTSASDLWYAEGCLNTGACDNGRIQYYAQNKPPKTDSGLRITKNNPWIYADTQVDEELGGLQYIYAENYDIEYAGSETKMTPNGGNSTRKYYWIVLPNEAYANSVGDTYVATFENVSEPVYFIVFDVHKCKDQKASYCDKARNNPDEVKAGAEFFGFLSKSGSVSKIADATGKLTSFCRIKGMGEVTASTDGNTSVSSGGGSSSSVDASTSGTSGTTETSGAGGCDFTKYNYSDEDLKRLAAIAASENGDNIESLKNEMSLMANLYESSRGSGYSSVLDYVINGKWFGSKKGSISGDRASSEQFAAAKDVFNNGNRTLPKEVDEHDCIDCGRYGYDITKIEIDGKTITSQDGLKNADNYVKNKTILHNKYGSTYTFYTWANPDNPVRSDPMGYTGDSVSCEPGGSDCSGSVVLKDVEDYPQYKQKTDHTCGPTSMAMLVSNGTGETVTEDDIVSVIGGDRVYVGGDRVAATKKVCEKYGCEAKQIDSTEDAIRAALKDGWMVHYSGRGDGSSYAINPFGSSAGHYVGLFGIDDDDQVVVANSAYQGNKKMSLHDAVKGHKGLPTMAIKFANAGGGVCEEIDYCEAGDGEGSGTNTSDDILKNVQTLIDLANQNGSRYEYGGSGRSIARFDKVLNEGDVNVIDCTGFASEVYYMTYKDEFKQSDIFYSNGIINGKFSSYKEVDRSEVRPGDIFAYDGHGGIVIEAENGVVTKIAETGGKGGRSGKNENIGYSDSSDYSVRKMNTSAGHFFRWKGAE